EQCQEFAADHVKVEIPDGNDRLSVAFRDAAKAYMDRRSGIRSMHLHLPWNAAGARPRALAWLSREAPCPARLAPRSMISAASVISATSARRALTPSPARNAAMISAWQSRPRPRVASPRMMLSQGPARSHIRSMIGWIVVEREAR